MHKKTIAVIATLDTKGEEADFVRQQIEQLGGKAVLIDMGLIDEPTTDADINRHQVIEKGGSSLEELLVAPDRQHAAPIIIAGTIAILNEMIAQGELHAVLGFGGTQGTSNCAAIMQALPYGLPKVLLSTMASGDTSAFVGIKDITMMFSVSDILGLNPLSRTILSNAAAAAWGMTQSTAALTKTEGKAVIGMTNLGVLTDGAMHALKLFRAAGHEVMVFHAVGSGGCAMEQLMKEGHIDAVFDYALGEISDEVHGGFRAASPERLTVAGSLGLPQVLCPGGTEHIGIFTEANVIPEQYKDHVSVFHNPIIFVPRLNADDMRKVGESICQRLASTKGDAVMMLPTRSTSRYGIAGATLCDPIADQALFDTLEALMPSGVSIERHDLDAEDPQFVAACVDKLLELIAK
ncbi:MAG: hypothetical protein ACI84O_001402 [Myxococcota bacterium]|jgi:uncharacterized protein (UPF0261 family)